MLGLNDTFNMTNNYANIESYAGDYSLDSPQVSSFIPELISNTDTYQGNDDFYRNLLSQGVDLVARVSSIAPNVLTAATFAALGGTASFVGVALFKGPKKALSYFDRYITFPLQRNFPNARTWGVRAKNNVISKVVDTILSSANKAYKATFEDFKKAKDSFENSLKQLEIDLNAAGRKGAPLKEMIQLFDSHKPLIKADHQLTIDCAENGLNACKAYLHSHSKYLPKDYISPQKKSVSNHYDDYRRWLGTKENRLSKIFTSASATLESELVDHLSNWNPALSESRVTNGRVIVDREMINRYSKMILAKFLNPGLARTFSFTITGEPAIDAGGVTREVITKLFTSLLEEGDGSYRSILNLGEYLYPYKGLGVALSQVALNPQLFLKEYFDRNLFTIIDSLSVDELALLRRGDDQEGVELIKQKLILALHNEDHVINSIFTFKNLKEKTDKDFDGIAEHVVEVLGYDDDDLEVLKTSNPEKYKAIIESEINTWLEENQHYYREADKLIAIAMYFNRAGSLDNIVAPLEREVLATATIESASLIHLNTQARACISKKIELIHDWIRRGATPEQLHQFIQFCTGASVLTD